MAAVSAAHQKQIEAAIAGGKPEAAFEAGPLLALAAESRASPATRDRRRP